MKKREFFFVMGRGGGTVLLCVAFFERCELTFMIFEERSRRKNIVNYLRIFVVKKFNRGLLICVYWFLFLE